MHIRGLVIAAAVSIASGCSTTTPAGTFASPTATTPTPHEEPRTTAAAPPPIRVTRPAPVATEYDLDRDGHPDKLWIDDDGAQAALVIQRAGGEPIRSPIIPGGFALIAIREFAGQPLIFYGFNANTVSSALVATFAGGRLRELATDDPVFLGGAVWNSHSLCCPYATADTACFTLDGRDALVLTESKLATRDGRDVTGTEYTAGATYIRAWTRRAYTIKDSHFAKIRDDQGVIERYAPSPPGVPLSNKLDCAGIALPSVP